MRVEEGWRLVENCANVEFLYYAKSVFSAVTGASKLHGMGTRTRQVGASTVRESQQQRVNNYIGSMSNGVMKNMGRLFR